MLMLIWILLMVEPAFAATYYVSPGVDTIPPVRDTIRSVNGHMEEDITVYLRGGTYWLTNPLTFSQRDSGSNRHNIIYRAYPGEKAVISGGTQITGWSLVGNGVYKAQTGSLHFRQLYVNGKPAIRAREPEIGSYYRVQTWDTANKRINIRSSDIAPWERLSEVEMVMQHHLITSRYRVTGFQTSGATASVAVQTPLALIDENKNLHGPFVQAYPFLRYSNPFHFENAYEFLDTEGEWYLNPGTGVVFYKAKAAEDVPSAEIIAPRLENLIKVIGAAGSPAHNIRFEGLTFQHSTWKMPSQGIFGSQVSDVLGITGAIHLENSNSITIERNTFRNIGGAGVALYFRNNDNVIRGNVITDTSGSGIVVDLGGALTDNLVVILAPRRANKSSRNIISNNYIRRAGMEYSGVGIGTIYADDTIIEHNELSDMPYTGIHVGWGWTRSATILRNNSIRYNRIYQVMNMFDDGGGIYTLSRQHGTKIVENYIHDFLRSPWTEDLPIAGIYLDRGSQGILVENNVVENVPFGLKLNHAAGNTIVNHAGTTTGGSVKNNSFVTDSSMNAAKVKSNAGLEPPYRDIITDIEKHPYRIVPPSAN